MNIRANLLTGFAAVTVIVLIAGVIGIVVSSSIGKDADNILYEKDPVKDISMEASRVLLHGQGALAEYMAMDSGLEEIKAEFEESVNDFDRLTIEFGRYSSVFTRDTKTLYQDFIDAANMMLLKMDESLDERALTFSYMKEVDNAAGFASEQLDNLESLADSDMASAMVIADRTQNSGLIALIAAIVAGIILAAVIGMYILFIISNPVKKITYQANEIAEGKLDLENLTIKSKDEIGQLAKAFTDMSSVLKYKAFCFEKIAAGDLTEEVKLASDKDTLGHAMIFMTEKLNEIMKNVILSANNAAKGSKQISASAQQFSTGAESMSSTVQQLSQGATE